MRFGAAYYPEHWPRERWETDARMMQEAGFNMVRMGEFAWTLFEPRLGEFDFAWLDESIALLGAHGIDTLLGTPTATPPGWLMMQDPEVRPVTQHGLVVDFGGRRHYCPTNAKFREHTARIVRAMGEHYANNPHVVTWQIDNELGCHQGSCHCPSCRAEFQRWLQAQYGTLEAINEAWGTVFWSETFTDWSEIPTPMANTTQHNPSLVLAWNRFFSDVWTDYYTFQANILRECGVKVPITTNLMGLFPDIDYNSHAKALDFVTWDNYPVFSPNGHYTPALAADYMRCVGGGKPYWVVEQQSGVGGWEKIFGRTAPGYMRVMAYQALAHGGEGILFFRWRSCRFGVEQYWHGILQQDGRPNWRYHEVCGMGKELAALPADLFTATTKADVALLYSSDQLWAHRVQPHTEGFDYNREFHPIYTALRDAGIDTDTVNEESDFTGYRVLIAPAWQLLPADTAERVIDFVRGGGILVCTFRSGVKDWDNVIFSDPLPGPLRQVLGITIDDYDALGSKDASVSLQLTGAAPMVGALHGTLWADVITAEDAEAAAVFTGGWYAGKPAITVNHFGNGEAWYIGTHLDAEFWKPFVSYLQASAEIPHIPATSAGVEIAHRHGERKYTFVINMSVTAGWIDMDYCATDLLTGEELKLGIVDIPGYGVMILA